MRKRLSAIGALSLFASSLFAQGLTTNQTKNQWEEINFEFNSSILSDGYPSLLRLAEILSLHRDYHVKVTGNTDFVGSARYNDSLAKRRAETVKEFLVKYGANADQVATAGDGKRDPEVSNKSPEGRFMNRRVVLTVTDGQGKVVADGGTTEVMPTLADLFKKQEECCNNILKRLDKLDDILAALRDLKGENDRLKGQLAELQNAEKALEDKVNGTPKPLTEKQTTDIAESAGQHALEEAQRRNKKFSLLGLNVGPTGGYRPDGRVTFSGSGQFFSPFGGDGTHAVQAQGEYLYYPGRQEGQFDIGLVNRWDHLQAGLFSSFKYIRLGEYQNGGSMGQGAFLLDYIFSRGRIGFYGTEGFKNTGALQLTQLGPTSFLETYARPMNQVGIDAQVGVWGDAWMQYNFGYIHSHSSDPNRPGGEIKLVQPIAKELAFTVAAGLNPTLITAGRNEAEFTFGLQFGNFMRPKDFTTFTHPVPMSVPRIRYELLTRQVGHSAPVADAGPNQIGIPAGTVTLNGSGSYSPDHEPLSFSWTQISGPPVAIAGANSAIATFSAAAGTTYAFRLTVTGQISNLSSSASTTVSTLSSIQVAQFSANPPSISAGQSSTLQWSVPNAVTVNINNGVGSNLRQAGTASVSPQTTTTYTLTATGPAGETVTATATVTVGASTPMIVRFTAAPSTITPGQSSTLSWATTNTTSVSISSVGSGLAPNGSQSVSPTQTTTYTLTATGPDGKTTVSATVTVTVSGGLPGIQSFTVSPSTISPGGTAQLCWNVTNATTVNITPGPGGVQPSGCTTVTAQQTTTYTLTATNSAGSSQANATLSVGSVQILSFSSSPSHPVSNTPVTLTWTTQNASYVIITGGSTASGQLPANGSLVVQPSVDTNYTLTAYGANGQHVSSVLLVFLF